MSIGEESIEKHYTLLLNRLSLIPPDRPAGSAFPAVADFDFSLLPKNLSDLPDFMTKNIEEVDGKLLCVGGG